MCAFEALAEKHSSVIVLRLTGVGRNDVHTQALADFLGLKCFMLKAPVRGGGARMIASMWALRSLLFRQYDEIYLGSYFSRFIRLVARFFRGEKFFLDDGVATLLSLKEMEKRGESHSIFTFFDITPLRNQTYVRHSFENLRRRFDIAEGGDCYFIGQPLPQKGLVGMDEYLNLVTKAADACDSVLYYIPHRVETDELVEQVATLDRVSVMRMETAIEVELLRKGRSPRAIYASYSTALLTLSTLFPRATVVSLIPGSLTDCDDVPHIKEIQDAFRSFGRISLVRC